MALRRLWLLLGAAALLLTSCTAVGSARSADEARRIVLDQVVQPESLDHPVIVFWLPEPLQPGDQIGPYNKTAYGPAVEPVTIDEESWFFWVDDAPGAHFAHPGRFVLVSRSSGNLTVNEYEWWPVLNGRGLWTESDDYWDQDNWAFSDLPPGPSAGADPSGGKGQAAPAAARAVQGGGPGAAIVINGWENGESGFDDFANDADGMHDLLTDAGFDVTYLGPTQDRNPDRDGEPTDAAPFNWFSQKASELEAGDTLVVYIGGHGGVSVDGIGGLGSVFENFLLQDLLLFDPGVHIIVILQGCKAGSFADSMRQVADVTIMATNATDPSYGDIDFEGDPNPDDRGSEFTSGFVEDWKEILADPQQRAEAEARGRRPGTNFWQELAALSHVSAVEKDYSAIAGWSFPFVVHGAPETRPTPNPTQTVLPDELNDGLGCVTGEPLSGETPSLVDISRAIADVLLSEPGGEPEEVRFTIELSRATTIDSTIYGGVEFADGATPISPENPGWFFDGIGNKNFSFGISGGTAFPELHRYDPSRGWRSDPSTGFRVVVDGNQIFVHVPVDEIPPNSPFYVSVTDTRACDAVGLGADREPTGLLPALLRN